MVAMRLGPLAVQVGFLLMSYALGVASSQRDASRPASPPERLPVAGSSVAGTSANDSSAVAAPAAAPAASAPEPRGESRRAASEPPAWSKVAARAQSWTVAVRADQSYGAGVAVEKAGFVLTNLHVVEGAKLITVTPFGAEAAPAQLVDSDRELDLALLRLSSALPNAAVLGRSSVLGVGDEVMAVGSPRKMYFSVSRGMVSFPNRFLDGVEYIQTDLPINVGNSGGPLVDREGSVVGIVSFILRDSQGISFALPIDRAVARFGEHLSMDAAAPAEASRVQRPAAAASK
jgi:S1-C subfamily serine protease